jgi:hypothetical protein
VAEKGSLLPHTCRSRYPPGAAQLGGKAIFHCRGPAEGGARTAVIR